MRKHINLPIVDHTGWCKNEWCKGYIFLDLDNTNDEWRMYVIGVQKFKGSKRSIQALECLIRQNRIRFEQIFKGEEFPPKKVEHGKYVYAHVHVKMKNNKLKFSRVRWGIWQYDE